MQTAQPAPRSAETPANGRRSTQRADPGRALGLALGRRAVECTGRCVERAANYRWEGREPSPAYVERVRAINWLATVFVARWLAYRIPVSKEEMRYISDRGDMAAAEQQSIVNLTRAYLIWRDTVMEALDEEAARLHSPRSLLEHARYIVRVSCDASLIQVARVFDRRIRRLSSDLAAERETLLDLALHDHLTGLPNRVLLYDRINQAVLAAKRNASTFAVLSIDLDGFKDVNDTFGHNSGDKVLQQISGRLVDAVRESDTVARWGGDEFTVVLAGAGADAVKAMVRQLETVVREPIEVGQQRVTVGATIGAALFPESGDDIHSLLDAADSAMYRIKRQRRAA